MPTLAAEPAPSTATPAFGGVAVAIRFLAHGRLKEFYRARGFWPLWVHDGAIGPEADRFIDLLANADLDGLNPKDYAPAKLRQTVGDADRTDPATLARAELALSQAFAGFVRDMRRAPQVKITYLDRELIPAKQTDADILRAAALAPSFPDYVKSVGWMSPIYLRLREARADFRDRWDDLPRIDIPTGPPLRAGAKGERVALLRRRLGLPDGTSFDKPLGVRLRAFQADHGLPAEGLAGDKTIAALNRDPRDYDRLIRLNLERTRLLPGPWTRHIVVDAASARLWLYRDGKEQGTMKVVAGKPTEQTPMLAGMVRYAILNPYWNVPTDLAQHRIAPKILAGATLTGLRFEALSDWSANPQLLDPATIDWHAVADGSQEVRLRQLPGGANAMGRVKFMFPNNLGIYLHDTPEKQLMAEKDRHFSSGCVRLEDAPRLGKWLFGKPLVAPSAAPEQQVPLPEPVRVYLTYLTVVPGTAGIAFVDDAYGRDGAGERQLARR